MTPRETALARLRRRESIDQAPGLAADLTAQGIGFAAVGGVLEERWRQAVVELDGCIGPLVEGGPAGLREGGPYPGSWIESTGSISAEVLARFAPEVAQSTFEQFATGQRDDGLIPYKVTADGTAFSQIQIVTPLARSVWHHYLLTGRDGLFLRRMFDAMVRNDAWLARHRDTLGTGGVEAFCTFDTGHDLSPRFWFAPDRCFGGEASRVDPESPVVPVVAPDLTANVACQRRYLALMAEELGEDGSAWSTRSDESYRALWSECWNAEDATFYDRDRDGEHVRVLSDVLLRVWASEAGEDEAFETSLRRHLMNTRGFLAHYGFTSLALSDPRFDHDFTRNSWGGPVNFLTQIRAPHAFERHGHHAELGLVSARLLEALARADRFPQCLDPWSGDAGYTSSYSPAILWLLDAVERWFGVLVRPDGEVWFSGLIPTRIEHGLAPTAVAASRAVGGDTFELAGDDAAVVLHRNGAEWASFPRGLRLVWMPAKEAFEMVNVSTGVVTGRVRLQGMSAIVTLRPNDRLSLSPEQSRASGPGVVTPRR